MPIEMVACERVRPRWLEEENRHGLVAPEGAWCLVMSLLFARILIRRARVKRAYTRGNVFTHAVTIAFRHSCILIVGPADIAVTLSQEQGSTLG